MSDVVFSTSGDIKCEKCIFGYGQNSKMCEGCPRSHDNELDDPYLYFENPYDEQEGIE